MTSDENEHLTQPADPAAGGIDRDASAEADTEGHSLLNGELARTIGQDRARETKKLVRDGARVREAHAKSGGGFLKRFGRG